MPKMLVSNTFLICLFLKKFFTTLLSLVLDVEIEAQYHTDEITQISR